MTRIDVENKIIDLVADKLSINKEEISMTSDFRKDLSADSLDISEFIMNLEDEFSITVPETEIMNLKTVGDVVNYVLNTTSTK